MFDYRGSLTTKQKIASTLIAAPIAVGAGYLFGKCVGKKAEEMSEDEQLLFDIQCAAEGLTDWPQSQAEARELIEKGAFVVSIVGGAVIGQTVSESTKAAIYHSTK